MTPPCRAELVTQTAQSPLSGGGVVRELGEIFNLGNYPFGLIIAAIFGLTTRLLTDRLRQQTDRYTEELKTTQAIEST